MGTNRRRRRGSFSESNGGSDLSLKESGMWSNGSRPRLDRWLLAAAAAAPAGMGTADRSGRGRSAESDRLMGFSAGRQGSPLHCSPMRATIGLFRTACQIISSSGLLRTGHWLGLWRLPPPSAATLAANYHSVLRVSPSRARSTRVSVPEWFSFIDINRRLAIGNGIFQNHQ